MYCKNLYTCAVLGALLLVLAPIHRVNGEEEGAPPEACATMTPGHPFDPQLLSSAPFKTEIPAGNSVPMGDTVRIELRAQNSLIPFKGFLVMAFDVNDDTKPIGTFKLPSDGKVIDCLQGVGNAATHQWKDDKKLVTIDWIPPTSEYTGTAIFRTTYVHNISTFWVKTESNTVSFVKESPVTTPQTPTTPSSASQSSSSMWAGLIAFSMLTLLMR
ncbi:hypothetical protein DAPPUDRAFT_304084 [Daphnia pulex]|uniref:Reelin domain-containing protein n=1 Tax=Daphnia pulex TaxID=6669 RepID=E9GIZ7_DAPPU|nr:hypothetical protein DAPPUDRAFT_304084 [Daphnia pulex]|eukprot:EFX80354.1 hypothetical protein DAPPUDRAFT_304084 [Daphnia pulex]